MKFGRVQDLTGGFGLKTRRVASCFWLRRGVLHNEDLKTHLGPHGDLGGSSAKHVKIINKIMEWSALVGRATICGLSFLEESKSVPSLII